MPPITKKYENLQSPRAYKTLLVRYPIGGEKTEI